MVERVREGGQSLFYEGLPMVCLLVVILAVANLLPMEQRTGALAGLLTCALWAHRPAWLRFQ